MKLTTRDIPGYLDKRPRAAVTLVYGPDHGLLKERAGIVARHIVPDLNDPFNVAVLTGEVVSADPSRFFDETSAISMLGGDRVVIVRGAGDGCTATLKSYLEDVKSGVFVVLEGDDLPAKSSLRKLCEAHANAAALPCYVQEAGDLSRLIQETVRGANLRIEPDATAFLTSAIGGDYQQVKSELSKLLTYMGVDGTGKGNGATVTYTDAVNVSGAMGLANLDAFIDALFLGDSEGAFKLYGRLEDDGIAPIALIRALLAHARKIHMAHVRMAEGERLEDMLDGRDALVFFKRKGAFISQVRKWPLERLSPMMSDILGCESRLKSSLDPDITIPQTLLSVATRAARAR